ncbi:MAG: cytochrome c oxidase subunit II [Gemmatales bacterium]|nr:MAG: cytochrome c oxidase subunit II [Gemmatales bacterium]
MLLVPGLVLCATSESTWGQIPEMFDPAGPNAESVRSVFWLVLAVCTVIFIVVGGTILAFVIRFRERTIDAETEPPQFYGSQPIELAWTLAPALTVLMLALVVIRSVIELRTAPPMQHDQRVRVVGHQWWWEFEYPDYGFSTANELVIPVSEGDQRRSIHLQLESADVIHSFWVPRLAGKTDLIPAKTNEMWLAADQEGTYFGRCAEYCGTQHAKMLIRVDVVSEAAFVQWVEQQKKPAAWNQAVQTGHDRFMELACANCHTIRGTDARGRFGPDLTHLMSRHALASGIMENTQANLTRWIKNPNLDKAGCRMPNMRLSDEDVQAIVDYLLTLR